ncbi:IS3 family transposase [Myxococcota bacterium]
MRSPRVGNTQLLLPKGRSIAQVLRSQKNSMIMRRTRRVASTPLTAPRNKLHKSHCARLLAALNSPEFRDLSPKQVIPLLADQGEYIASESTAYRLLRAKGLLKHREPSRTPSTAGKPDELVAALPNQVWCWDITYVPAYPHGTFYYLYMFEDLRSRRIVGWEVHEVECMELFSALVLRLCTELEIDRDTLTNQADKGGPMRGSTMLHTLDRLGVTASFSRPRVSDDNPFAESLFCTMKYRPAYPRRPFASLQAARAWVAEFVYWYNTQHLHSALNYVTPDARYYGRDASILAKRARLYEAARRRHPERWSGDTRDWSPVGAITLNPANGKSAVTSDLLPAA